MYFVPYMAKSTPLPDIRRKLHGVFHAQSRDVLLSLENHVPDWHAKRGLAYFEALLSEK